MPLRVREASASEYATIAALTVAAYEALFGGEHLHAYRTLLEDVESRAAAGQVLVAVDDAGAIVGSVGYVAGPGTAMSEFDDADACGMRMLAVDPTRRGEGAGRALTEACLARGREAGRLRVLLWSTPAMAVARGLYGRLGFRRVPERDVLIPSEQLDGDPPLHLMAYERPLEVA